MLTEREKQGINKILQLVPSWQLMSLAKTVTKGIIDCWSEIECQKAIISFERSGEDFLRHKIITKKIICQYALKDNISIPLGDLTKDDVIHRVLRYWQYPEIDQQSCNAKNPKESSSFTEERTGLMAQEHLIVDGEPSPHKRRIHMRNQECWTPEKALSRLEKEQPKEHEECIQQPSPQNVNINVHINVSVCA